LYHVENLSTNISILVLVLQQSFRALFYIYFSRLYPCHTSGSLQSSKYQDKLHLLYKICFYKLRIMFLSTLSSIGSFCSGSFMWLLCKYCLFKLGWRFKYYCTKNISHQLRNDQTLYLHRSFLKAAFTSSDLELILA
jgi:hypothetical protein